MKDLSRYENQEIDISIDLLKQALYELDQINKIYDILETQKFIRLALKTLNELKN